AAIRTKPPPRKRPLSSSPLSITSTITPKRSKVLPTKPLSSSARKANSLPSTAQNDLKPILEMMQQQSGKMARVSDTEDQDVREDDYADRLADLSGIDFSLPHIPRTKNIIATPMKIGFLGLGAMGSGMVTNLLNSGHEVTVWNRTPSSVSKELFTCFVPKMMSWYCFHLDTRKYKKKHIYRSCIHFTYCFRAGHQPWFSSLCRLKPFSE
ncbi:hypothetical protein NP493_258g01001, partial [Ridgeia piscesae]